MSEQRMIDIETRLAHQDQLLLELNAAVSRQQEDLMRLERTCNTIIDRLRALTEAMPEAGTPRDERPPHY